VKKYAVIVAGGNGQRMLSEIPKQFHLLGGKPVLLHSLEAFAEALPDLEIILVLPQDHTGTWEEMMIRYRVSIPHTIVSGGATRFQSVKNGLRRIQQPGLVAVHDGVRPLITKATICRLFAEAEQFESAVPVVPIHDTVRQTIGGHSQVIDRNNLRLVQTPEIFHSGLLLKAYESPESASFTDVTSVVEHSGLCKVHFCDGEAENIKITRPFDFLLAEAILKSRK
jgi:2-C-methyl-D-erythritol 4-phosphate cytidylyltransferase